MEGYTVDVLSLLLRWLHMITGIAWIGASFYFVMLDTSLKSPKKSSDTERGVFGELWAVHGGGFYNSQKFLTGPRDEPLTKDLHWSKWEAYTTWLSGISLLILIYWYSAEIYLIDASVMALTKSAAIGISAAFLAGGWLIYDVLCKSPLARSDKLLGFVVFVLVAVGAWALCQFFSGRGAYMIFGAMLGTIMVANVFFVIMPGQRKMVANLYAGEPVDPKPGQDAKQRSVHNTYFTLPVLFTMISNHYAFTYSHEYNWLALIGITIAGALIRVFFVSRHSEGPPAYAAAASAVVLLAVVIVGTMPRPSLAVAGAPPVDDATVQAIVAARCTVCHSATPTQPGWAAAPNGIMYDSIEQIKVQSAIIYQQSVVSKAMPIANVTGMTDEERAKIAAWYLAQ
jgi:uncharacterized membrane protein